MPHARLPHFGRNEQDLELHLAETCRSIKPVDSPELRRLGQERLDNLTKPLGSLGRLEEAALRLFMMSGGKKPLEVFPALLFTIAGDHGVVAEGVAANPQEVTRQMVLNFLAGGAGINALCRSAGMRFMAVDAGVIGPDFSPHQQLVNAKTAQGTANLALGPAMSRHDCLKALHTGLLLAEKSAENGVRCLAAGEMGIGNTTPSSALYCAFLGLSPEDAAGAGAGLPPDKVAHKAEVVKRGLKANSAAVQSGDPLAVLAALGGFEIAAMSGLMLGSAAHGIPFLVDGFIAGAAFVAAWKMAPPLADYCFFAHSSAEKAHREVLARLNALPLLDLGLRLGEGTGAALALPVLKGACAIFNEMASFAQAGVAPVSK